MYAAHFGLSQDPFSIAPDPRYLYMSERHREALAHLLYGVGGGGGFVLLSGEVGTGKTTVCRCFLEQIPAHCNVAYIFNPRLTVLELLQSVCEEFHVDVPPAAAGAVRSPKDFIDPLNAFLLQAHAAGRSCVLIIDEAQNLSADVLEQLRLLTNLETNERKLLQIILIGQPELRAVLARPDMEQLAQRVIARYHLQALSPEETAQYIAHRLAVGGLTGPMPFDAGALKRIHQLTRGIPRRINLLCGRALLGAYAHGLGSVTRPVVDKAAAEVFETEAPAAGPWRPTLAWMAAGGVAALLVLVVLGIWAWPGGGMGGRGVAGASSGVALGSASGAMPGIAASGAAAPASRASAAGVVASGPAAIGTGPAAGAAADWAALARLWGASAGAAPACEAAVAPPLACHRVDNASLAVLRKLDRPGVVTLRGSDGTERPAVLASLSRREAVVEVAGARQALGLKEFARRWRGDFTTLWRMPPGYSGKLVEGASGPAMDWMAAQLAAAQGASAPASAQALDAGWKARLVAFQRAQGVPADGRAGPVTFMQLNRASGVAEPRLAAQGS